MSIFSLILLVVLFGPSLCFFIAIRRYKRPPIPLDQEEQSVQAGKAKKYLAISAAACFVVLLFPFILMGSARYSGTAFTALVAVGLIGVITVLVTAAKGVKHSRLAGMSIYRIVAQSMIAVAAHLGILGYLGILLAGMGWGRPLRVAGKILKPSLRIGDEWAQGERPDAVDIDEPTRRALEALWLHDAKKEYASVPAFSRLGWQLAALAAPPELLRDVHIAALQEIEHARKCFALAAGFGGQPQTVLPMPAMLDDACGLRGNALLKIAAESLSDGCLLEGFNADVAYRSSLICRDPVSLKVIKQIAREERSHAELSWRVVAFCYQQDPKVVGIALRKEMAKLATLDRPTASSSQNLPVVQAADAEALIRYGRLPDGEFDVIWRDRMQDT